MDACVACQNPLIIEVDYSDSEDDVQMGGSSSAAARTSQTVPDDVHLNCGCHFHWECLLEAYSVTECPNCHASIVSTAPDGGQQVLSHIHNEGGQQQNVDILPLLSEEGYLKAYPEERKCRAFLEFCRDGDVDAVIHMLQDEDSDDDDAMQDGPKIDILRYQDTLGEMQSGLHAAVQGGSEEVVWLLLLLASNLDYSQFPQEVFDAAKQFGVEREDQTGKEDIRTLKDAQGRTAEALAAQMGGVWAGWPGTGRLGV
ncbi:putative ring finger-like protein [Lasiodiplodia theobromae]|uniref:Uncharacterized protein n=2 Tax=Lasiodiplodia TaxID=66739 RepID=A0A5N5DQS6_9PEZI|nr:uncharacterized protein LTHEOB_848 [Lasiodiplodia theobromae]KAB2580000.1 hypothetical protein DBV05_g1460 [Lasiodiplodia theobromae]KAF4540906.1 hypothetical protein LTHEOB_848 [Lasiodiplodia theobromae]KAF9634611.1 putative ring finger-like protein [Lasiodiplodia theobromae]KAK0660298.1 hypothetical protein DIS24_g3346 [Lasiodiplodia hormozganensis]